jgi:hypothetical protein
MLPSTRLTLFLLLFCAGTSGQAKRNEIEIDEIFADPLPSAGLPLHEFIELKNISATAIDLKDWKIADNNSSGLINTNFILFPDSLVIICSATAAPLFRKYGAVVGITNFPSLDNEEDIIQLTSKEGLLIHAVAYEKRWYQNDVKSDGGWSLEMIDTHNPCSGFDNWKASVFPDGGTPGRKNSIDRYNPDEMPPALIRGYTKDSLTVVAVFDEPLDGTVSNTNFRIDNGIGIPAHVEMGSPLFNQVILTLDNKLSQQKIYQLTINNVRDCAGNSIGLKNGCKIGLPSRADPFDIVINEILFNPTPGGFDYVEFYNRSNKVLDAKNLYIANRTAGGGFGAFKSLVFTPFLFFPGDYLVITEDGKWLQQNFLTNSEMVLQISSMPALPDDKGTIILLDLSATVIDELKYDESWHFQLLDNKEGISLERLDYNEKTQVKDNWTSAASAAGFGTPGYKNSHFSEYISGDNIISVSPKIFSPDNDGYEDFAAIQVKMVERGYVANISIFDVNGRMVRHLTRNAVLGYSGKFFWDGLDDKARILPIGIYIVVTEIFNLKGKTKKFKNIVTLARKF